MKPGGGPAEYTLGQLKRGKGFGERETWRGKGPYQKFRRENKKDQGCLKVKATKRKEDPWEKKKKKRRKKEEVPKRKNWRPDGQGHRRRFENEKKKNLGGDTPRKKEKRMKKGKAKPEKDIFRRGLLLKKNSKGEGKGSLEEGRKRIFYKGGGPFEGALRGLKKMLSAEGNAIKKGCLKGGNWQKGGLEGKRLLKRVTRRRGSQLGLRKQCSRTSKKEKERTKEANHKSTLHKQYGVKKKGSRARGASGDRTSSSRFYKVVGDGLEA